MTNFYLYNLTTKQRLQALTTGASIAQGNPPLQWDIEVDPGLPVDRTEKFFSSIDNGPIIELEQPPYLLAHRQALNLKDGSHSFAFNSPGQQTTVFKFSVANTPAVIPDAQIAAFTGGGNFAGANNPKYAPTPTLVASLKKAGCKIVRFWFEYKAWQQAGEAYWTQINEWAALGFVVFLQFQYNDNGYQMYPDPILAEVASAVPASVAIFSPCNEIDTKWDGAGSIPADVYYIGTGAQMIHAMAIFRANLPKTTAMSSPSFVHGLAGLQAWAQIGGLIGCKYADQHLYPNTGELLGSQVQAHVNWCGAEEIEPMVSEASVRPEDRTPANWAKELAVGVTAAAKTSVSLVLYSVFPTEGAEGDEEDDATLLNTDGTERALFAAAWWGMAA